MKVLMIPVDGDPQLVELTAHDSSPDGLVASRENTHKALRELLDSQITYLMHAQLMDDCGLDPAAAHLRRVPIIVARVDQQGQEPGGPAFRRYGVRGPVVLATLDQAVKYPAERLCDPFDALIERWLPGSRPQLVPTLSAHDDTPLGEIDT